MSDCSFCPVEKSCCYPYRPCECVGQRKFWTSERRAEWDRQQDEKNRREFGVGLAQVRGE